MGNQSSFDNKEKFESLFDLDEIQCVSSKNIEKQNILVDDPKDGILISYLVHSKGVEMITLPPNLKKLSPSFSIGENSALITHSLLIKGAQRHIKSTDQDKRGGSVVILIFMDCKLAMLSGDGLQLLKTIQLFAPLEAFHLSLIYNLKFSIKEDVLHKKKQEQLLSELMQQREDFQRFFSKGKQKLSIDDDDICQDDKNNQKVNVDRKMSGEKEDKDTKEKVNPDSQVNSEIKEQDNINAYGNFVKAQYDIFTMAQKMATGNLLDIQSICFSGNGIICVGYNCGLVQKVTIERPIIDIKDECIFFNPLNLKSQTELQLVFKDHEDNEIPWESLNILPLHSVFSVNNQTFVISVHQSVPLNSSSESTTLDQHPTQRINTLVYVYEYQNGKKISYFDCKVGKIQKAFVNTQETTNRNILYLLDQKNTLSLYNFEKGTHLQAFSLDPSMQIIDALPHFYRQTQMFSPLPESFNLLSNMEKFADRTIDGDILIFFAPDSRTLITQLDYKLIQQTSGPQKQVTKKIINQHSLKLITSKIPCNYKLSAYSPQADILLISGTDGKLLQFTNFLSNIYFHL